MQFYGQFAPPVDRFIFERYFPDPTIQGVFVECGAFDGLTECSCKFFEESMGWSGYNFEPVPWIFEKLCANRPNSRNLNFALSNSNGESIFKAVEHPLFGMDCTNGSLAHTEAHARWLDELGCSVVEVRVKLQTWANFVSNENLRHVDLLVLDVEGHELSVIEGMSACPVLPDVICIEIGHLSLASVREHLSAPGYVYDISSHANAFFVREIRLALFAMRRAHAIPVHKDIENCTLQQRNEALSVEVATLQRTLNEIQRSRAWRAVETYRRWKTLGRKGL